MREIKFRIWAKRHIGGQIIYLNGYKQYYDFENGYVYAFCNDYPEFSAHENYIEENEDFEVMQYTGLKENAFEDTTQNKEIYEGDIIQFSNLERLVVEWNDDICQWQYSDGSLINSGERYSTYKIIVGNIYENPDLIKQPN